MKRFGALIYIFAFLFLGMKCYAQSQYSPTITKMEKSLFGVDYSSQNDDARLKRIEETVYGSASSVPLSQKMAKLSKDLSADLIGQEITPKKDTFADDNDSPKEPIAKADSSVNYPMVNILEKSVFNKEFKTTEINQRLANLEKKVFQKTYSDDLSSRVDRLKQAVMPRVANNANVDDNSEDSYEDSGSLMDQTSQFQDDGYGSSGYGRIPRQRLGQNFPTGFGAQVPLVPEYNSNNSVMDDYQSDSDIAIPLASLEKMVLRKSFPNDTVSNRLSRLELKVFNSTFIDDDEQTRLDRVSSAYQAQKTSKKYDSNKFAQHSATAMQVGAILLMILAAVL